MVGCFAKDEHCSACLVARNKQEREVIGRMIDGALAVLAAGGVKVAARGHRSGRWTSMHPSCGAAEECSHLAADRMRRRGRARLWGVDRRGGLEDAEGARAKLAQEEGASWQCVQLSHFLRERSQLGHRLGWLDQIERRPAALLIFKGFYSALNTGGEGGIRTRGGLLTLTRFPGVRLKPLIHLSSKPAIVAAVVQLSAVATLLRACCGSASMDSSRLTSAGLTMWKSKPACAERTLLSASP